MKKRVLACAVLGAAVGLVTVCGATLAAAAGDAEGWRHQGVGDAVAQAQQH